VHRPFVHTRRFCCAWPAHARAASGAHGVPTVPIAVPSSMPPSEPPEPSVPALPEPPPDPLVPALPPELTSAPASREPLPLDSASRSDVKLHPRERTPASHADHLDIHPIAQRGG